MNFGMSLGISLKLSQSLELRQSMELALSQELFVAQQVKLALNLYQERESALTRLYKTALKRGMVRFYNKHGMKFKYTLVRAKDVPNDVDLKNCGCGFSHCLYNAFEALLLGRRHALARGSWLLFVVYDMYPNMSKHYIEYTAVHERGEQVTLGDHNLASKLEFAIAKKENRLTKYMKWIEENCPAKFADVFSYQTHLNLPDTKEFQKVLETFSSSEEATKIRQMIEEFEWPYRLLQKLTLYQKRNEEVVEIVTRALRVAEILVGESGLPLKELVSRVRDEVAKQLRLIVQRELKRYISFPRLNALWHELRIGVDKKFVEMLNVRRKVNPNYLQELVDAGISDSLPQDGVLSLSFTEALQAL